MPLENCLVKGGFGPKTRDRVIRGRSECETGRWDGVKCEIGGRYRVNEVKSVKERMDEYVFFFFVFFFFFVSRVGFHD